MTVPIPDPTSNSWLFQVSNPRNCLYYLGGQGFHTCEWVLQEIDSEPSVFPHSWKILRKKLAQEGVCLLYRPRKSPGITHQANPSPLKEVWWTVCRNMCDISLPVSQTLQCGSTMPLMVRRSLVPRSWIWADLVIFFGNFHVARSVVVPTLSPGLQTPNFCSSIGNTQLPCEQAWAFLLKNGKLWS